MNKFKLFFWLCLISAQFTAKAQEKVSYQSLLLDENGPMVSQSVALLLTVSQGNTENRTILYQESHLTTTNSSGLVSLNLGSGISIAGNWSEINWSLENLYLETYLQEGSTSKLISVAKINASPKALYAALANTVTDYSISTDKIQDGAITADKLADGVIPAITPLTKEDIVALGIPGADTNTIYRAGTGIEIVNDTIQIANLNIDTDQIQDGAITADKLADGVIPAITPLTKEAIVALGIPGADTNTIYRAGTGIEIVNDTIQIAQNLANLDDFGVIEATGLINKNNAAAESIPDLADYNSPESFFSDYSFFLGKMDTISRLFVEQTITRFSAAEEVSTETIELLSPDEMGSILVSTQRDNDDIELLVSGNVVAAQFKGDGSLLSNLPVSPIDTTRYQPIKGLYIRKLTADIDNEITQEFEDYMSDPVFSDDFDNSFMSFVGSYTDIGSQYYPLLIGKIGTDANPKGVVFANAIAGDMVMTNSLQSTEVLTADITTDAIRTSNQQEILGVTSENDIETVTITADRFVGDGSALTGLSTVVLDTLNTAQGFYKLKVDSSFEPREDDIEESVFSWIMNETLFDNLQYFQGVVEFDEDEDGEIDDDWERFSLLVSELMYANSIEVQDAFIDYLGVNYISTEAIDTETMGVQEIYVDGYGVIVDFDDNQDLVVSADKFIGDGSALTGISDLNIADDANIDFDKLDITAADIESLGVGGINTNDNANVTLGYDNLGRLTTGLFNVGLGRGNLDDLTSGNSNIGLGTANLEFLTVGNYNLAIGNAALYYLSGDSGDSSRSLHNIGVGNYAGRDITTGSYNIAIGHRNLSDISSTHKYTGDNNIAIGTDAGNVSGISYTGSSSIYIGTSSGPIATDSNGVAIGAFAKIGKNATSIGDNSRAEADYSVAIGYLARSTTANRMQLGAEAGSYAITSVRNTAADTYFKSFNVSSDERLKKDIQEVDRAGEILGALRPVVYQKRGNLQTEVYDKTEYGFIAQEVQQVIPELVVETGGEDNLLVMNYNGIIAVLTKALQEQKAEIEALKQQVNLLMSER